MTNNPDLHDLLGQLQSEVTQELLERVKSGVATDGDIRNALGLLKNNNIVLARQDALVDLSSDLKRLRVVSDDEQVPDRREAQ